MSEDEKPNENGDEEISEKDLDQVAGGSVERGTRKTRLGPKLGGTTGGVPPLAMESEFSDE